MFQLVVAFITILAVSQGQEHVLEVSPPIVDTLKQENVTLNSHPKGNASSLANESAFERNELVELIKKLDDLTQNVESKVSMMMNRIDKIETFLAKFGYPMPPKFVASNATDAESWPDGEYGLPATIFGCPSNNSGTWLTGYIKHHTESTEPNHDQVSSNNDLQQPVMERSNNENYMYQRFCMIRSTSDHLWPSGSYCIAPEGDSCPQGFHFDSITWDNENTNPSRVVYQGRLPFITFPPGETNVYYCCRSDAPANTTIYLPNDRPFYLYRYKSECQDVSGMTYREDFMLFDTENFNNTDRYSSQIHPDGQAHDDVRLELCFYFPKLKEL